MLGAGDRIFYADNGSQDSQYCQAAIKVIQDLGLIYFFYQGAGLDARRSSLDREIRDDFYNAKVVVVVLGRGKGWRSMEDIWALPELKHAAEMGIKCLVYTTENITEEELKSLELPVPPVFIKDVNDFRTTLRKDLER